VATLCRAPSRAQCTVLPCWAGRARLCLVVVDHIGPLAACWPAAGLCTTASIAVSLSFRCPPLHSHGRLSRRCSAQRSRHCAARLLLSITHVWAWSGHCSTVASRHVRQIVLCCARSVCSRPWPMVVSQLLPRAPSSSWQPSSPTTRLNEHHAESLLV
jgi:hypothetical protein